MNPPSKTKSTAATTAASSCESRQSDSASRQPLKLVAFERYMLADDRPSHPMSFTIRLKFSGTFDEACFRQAAVLAARRHPLLASHVRPDDRGRLAWHLVEDPTPYVDIAPHSEPLRFPGSERIDLQIHTGLRIWVRTGDGRTEMRLQFHHSCADGVGAYQFIEDLLVCYEQTVHPELGRAVPRPLDPARLARRARFGLSWWQTLLRLPAEIWGLVIGSFTFFLGRPAALAANAVPEETPAERLRLLDYPAYTFTPAESRNLLDAAKRADATMNDLLLRDHLLAMHSWNVLHDTRLRRRSLRIMVPIDLRVPGDEALSCADVVTMVYIDRFPAMCKNHDRMLWLISLETAFLKRFKLGLSFIRGLALYGAIPGGFQFLTRANRCYATAVLSNLGVLFRGAPLPRDEGKLVTGDLRLERIESAPPVRPFTAAGITTLSYGGQLTIVFNYDRHHFVPEEAQRMLDTIVVQLRRTAGVELDAPPTPQQTGDIAATARVKAPAEELTTAAR